MTRTYAEDTRVPIEKTKAEIEKLLTQRGASAFLTGWDGLTHAINFRLHDRQIRIIMEHPPRATGETLAKYEQAGRARWRALLLIIKAKFAAIDAGITTIEREFMPDVVMSNGQTVSQWIDPQIEIMYTTGSMPPLLPGVDPRDMQRRILNPPE
jgi:hypothetical protein